MKNIKLTLSWNGAKFNGYQYQPHAITVQETLNKAWYILTQETVTLYGCSRLDAQVHASHYVLHFFSQTNLEPVKIIRALNGILCTQLNAEISVYNCEFVDKEFHARFHAVGKHYRYLLWYGFKTHALLTPKCWHIHSKNEPKDLSSIFKQFEGTHDFAAFRASDCSAKNTIKNIYMVKVTQDIVFPEMTMIDFYGDGFLKNMIRNIVGTATQVSIGKLNYNCITEAFEHKKRELVGVCAPGHALTLMQVFYDKNVLIDKISQS